MSNRPKLTAREYIRREEAGEDPQELAREVGFTDEQIRQRREVIREAALLVDQGMREEIDRGFGEGAWDHMGGSFLPLFSGRPLPEDTLRLLARGLAGTWWLDPRAKRKPKKAPDPPPVQKIRLLERAEEMDRTFQEEKLLIAQQGVLLAIADLGRAQTIRIGKKWVVDESGKKALVEPRHLLLREACRWLASAAKRAAVAALMDTPWPTSLPSHDPLRDPLPLEDTLHVEDVTRSPLDDLIWQEDLDTLFQMIEGAGLTDGETEFLAAYLETGSWVEAGEALGLEAVTRRQRKLTLGKKLPIPPS